MILIFKYIPPKGFLPPPLLHLLAFWLRILPLLGNSGLNLFKKALNGGHNFCLKKKNIFYAHASQEGSKIKT